MWLPCQERVRSAVTRLNATTSYKPLQQPILLVLLWRTRSNLSIPVLANCGVLYQMYLRQSVHQRDCEMLRRPISRTLLLQSSNSDTDLSIGHHYTLHGHSQTECAWTSILFDLLKISVHMQCQSLVWFLFTSSIVYAFFSCCKLLRL